MTISGSDIAGILTAVAGLITVVGGFVMQFVMMKHQNRRIDNHAADIKQDIAVVREQTGVFKALSNGGN